MNKPYKLPERILINRVVAESLKTSLRGILECHKRHNQWDISESDQRAFEAFIELMNAKDQSTLNYITKIAEESNHGSEQ